MPKHKKPPAQKPKQSAEEKPAPAVNLDQWLAQLPQLLNGKVSPEKLSLLAAQTMVISQAKPTDGLASTAAPSHMPLIIRTQAALREAAEQICKATNISLDIETSDLDPRRGEIVGVGVAIEGQAFYFPTAHRFEDTGDLRPDQLPVTDVVERLQLERRQVIAHNAKFEMRWLRHHTGVTLAPTWDTMLAARLIRSDLSADLEDLAVRVLDVPKWGFTPAEMQRLQFMSVDQVASYCAKDCRYTLQIFEEQKKCLKS